jgi:hypothetical protein
MPSTSSNDAPGAGRHAASRCTVITSIFPPTEAVRAFAGMAGHRLIVVGDRKTPEPWSCAGVEYMSVADQESAAHSLARLLPYDHYCRKMLGYLRAIELGAEVIVDTDDDNIPKADWRFPAFDGEFDRVPGGRGFVNAYRLFTDQRIWPRGLPLDRILADDEPAAGMMRGPSRVGVWQGLADGDPDVDAIYRLTSDVPCTFRRRDPVVLGAGTLSPYNSQNTATRRELFPLLYMPVFVTFRFTDILRGLVAQPIMAGMGFELGFVDATVVQRRNPHDYMKDFVSEIPMYQHSARVADLVGASVSPGMAIGDALVTAYAALLRAGIVRAEELPAVEAWIRDCESLSPRGS